MCNQTHADTNIRHKNKNISYDNTEILTLQDPPTPTQGSPAPLINDTTGLNENDIKIVGDTTDTDVVNVSPLIGNNNNPGNPNTSYQGETLDENKHPDVILSELRKKNFGRLIIGHLNINSIRNKFEALKLLLHGNIDIFVVSETKIDESFPISQFAIDGFTTPIRRDRNNEGGGLLIYIREDIPCKVLKNHLPNNVEGLFVELNLRNKKWLLFGGYNPNKENISYFLNHISKDLDTLIGNYDNLLLIGDFNSQMEEEKINDFCDTYNLQNLINDPTCFKNSLNPTLIDMVLTNREKSFHNSCCIETGISDFHKMTITILKTFFRKLKPTKIKYRNYKNFDIESFKAELNQSLQTTDHVNMTYDEFKDVFMKSLDEYAPLKEKFIRGNNAPFMNKTLSKAFMQRAKLKNKYNKVPTEENNLLYKNQRNYCANLLKKVKRDYYNNLDINIFKDNKTFWKSIRPFFSDKQKDYQKEFILMDNDEVTSDGIGVAEKLNNYFVDVIENLDILPFIEDNEIETNTCHVIDTIVSKYKNHPSILKIKEYVNITEQFLFIKTTTHEIQNQILKLDPKKASVENDIPTKMLIETNEISTPYLNNIYHKSIDNQVFPESLKLADVIPTHKKEERTKKENYRPISLLPTISKLYERDMYNQILGYIEKYLSPYLFGFRKGHSTEQCLNVMLERWKRALDQRMCAGAVLTDLSKAFDCLNHQLLIAKLEAYGFSHEALAFIYSYLSKRHQRTKIKSCYSSWREIKFGVPQGSILGPLLFNIFLNDIFLFVENTNITNYADDNTPYAIESSIEKLIETLEHDSNILLNWFQTNEMVSNNDKCHLIIINSEDNIINIGNEEITGSNSVKLLGVTIDNKLNFNDHVTNICKKANKKAAFTF